MAEASSATTNHADIAALVRKQVGRGTTEKMNRTQQENGEMV
ncbi:MAG: hypothetical protein ACJ788_05880 [Ktedonobacteraceae bacterium]